jgi:hypothetical protein
VTPLQDLNLLSLQLLVAAAGLLLLLLLMAQGVDQQRAHLPA